MDVPDRLPYEVLDALYGDTGPPISRHHQPRHAFLVISSKRSGTFRPLVRFRATDLILYQALVDRLAPDIEGALAPRDRVGAYRQDLTGNVDAFAGTMSNDEFRHAIRQHVKAHPAAFVLETDISGYFLSIRLPQLQETLLDCSDRPDAVHDLINLLSEWQNLGVRGLPQGIRPSSPLGNLYLASLDRLLARHSLASYRWMDDMWILCDSYSAARRVQDLTERHLYGLGLTLNGEKTRILRSSTAAGRLETPALRFEERREEAVEDLVEILEGQDYLDPADIPDDEEIDRSVTIADHDRLTATLGDDVLPGEFSAEMGLVYRQLTKLRDAHGLPSISRVLIRSPHLSTVALRYAAEMGPIATKAVVAVFADVLARVEYTRDFEKLNLCHKAVDLKRDPKSNLGDLMGELALRD